MSKYIVIGAGILGAATGYHLAKAGVDVTIIDRNDEGQATDAAAGMICPWLTQRRNKAWYFLAKNGAAYYPNLIKQLGDEGETDLGYRKVGAISIHKDFDKLKKIYERGMKRREDAPEIGDLEMLTPEETQNRFPLLDPEYAGVYVSGAARVDGRALRKALVKSAVKNGAKFIQGSAELEIEGQEVIGVKVREERLEADKILITAGAWADQLLSPLGIRLKITYQKGQLVHLQMKDTDTNDYPVIIPPHNQDILPFDDGKIVIGATHEDDAGFDLRVTAGGLHEIFDKALQAAPGLSDAEFVEARVGFRPYTPGFLPVIGKIPGLDGLFLANGLGASGLTVAPYLGLQLAKLAMGEELELDLNNYPIEEVIG